jgi:hypothetical protein
MQYANSYRLYKLSGLFAVTRTRNPTPNLAFMVGRFSRGTGYIHRVTHRIDGQHSSYFKKKMFLFNYISKETLD